jgi:hypothetical protein
MHPLTQELATKRANLDGEPRIVAHGGVISIVTPTGEIWQVFDLDSPDGAMRDYPLSDDRVYARIFVRMDAQAEPRIYRFAAGESRSTGPVPLLMQLEGARAAV